MDACCSGYTHVVIANNSSDYEVVVSPVAEDKHLMVAEACQLMHKASGIVHLCIIIIR